jgi:hypothetical protein
MSRPTVDYLELTGGGHGFDLTNCGVPVLCDGDPQ